MTREEPSTQREFTPKKIREAMRDAGVSLDALSFFASHKEGIAVPRFEDLVRNEINKQIAKLSTLDKYKNKDGTFGNKGAGRHGSDAAGYSVVIMQEVVRRVAKEIKIAKPAPPNFRGDWERASLDVLTQGPSGESAELVT
jgi:hypothetical protein